MSEPTLQDVLDAINGLSERMDRMEQLLIGHTKLLTQVWKRIDGPEDDRAFQEVNRLQAAGDD